MTAVVFKTFASANRMRIAVLLAAKPGMSVSEIAGALGRSAALTTQHLQTMEAGGAIRRYYDSGRPRFHRAALTELGYRLHNTGAKLPTFAALALPVRYDLTRLIAARPGCRQADLLDLVPYLQPTLSHHIRILAAAGLVDNGRNVDGSRSLTATVFYEELLRTVEGPA